MRSGFFVTAPARPLARTRGYRYASRLTLPAEHAMPENMQSGDEDLWDVIDDMEKLAHPIMGALTTLKLELAGTGLPFAIVLEADEEIGLATAATERVLRGVDRARGIIKRPRKRIERR